MQLTVANGPLNQNGEEEEEEKGKATPLTRKHTSVFMLITIERNVNITSDLAVNY